MINPLDIYFKMVATNTGASSIQEAAAMAKVFLFCERHNSSKYQIANSRAYDFLSTPGACFFVEGPVKSHIPESKVEIQNKAISWEDVNLTEEGFKELDEQREKLFSATCKFYLFLLSASLIVRSLERTRGVQTENFDGTLLDGFFTHIEELKKYDFFNSLSFPGRDNFDGQQIDSFVRALAQNWKRCWEKNLEDFSNEIDKQALVRNTQLSNTLLKAHREGATRILAIAGSDHLKIPKHLAFQTEQGRIAIAALYQSLHEAGIPYLTLKATNKHLPVPELSSQPFSSSAKGKEPAQVANPEQKQSLPRQDVPSSSSGIGKERAYDRQEEQYQDVPGPSHVPLSSSTLKRSSSEANSDIRDAKRIRIEDYVKDIRERSLSQDAGNDAALNLEGVEEKEEKEIDFSSEGSDDGSYDFGSQIEIPAPPSDMSDFDSDDESEVSFEERSTIDQEPKNLDELYFMGAVTSLQDESHLLRSRSTTSIHLNRQLMRTMKYIIRPLLERGVGVFKEDVSYFP